MVARSTSWSLHAPFSMFLGAWGFPIIGVKRFLLFFGFTMWEQADIRSKGMTPGGELHKASVSS